jgi:predicted DNA-binding transcriptional regulator AlpA
MTHYTGTYRRDEWAGLGWVQATCNMTMREVHEAIARRGFPPPSRNVVCGHEKWNKSEVLAWLDMRGVRRTLAFG